MDKGARRLNNAPRARTVVCAAMVASALLWPRALRADGVADEAELHFQRGAESYQKGDYPAALEHFLASNRLVPNRNVVYNVARAFEQLKRFADAHRYYSDALRGETEERNLQDIQAALARIAPHVAVLLVSTTPPNATLYIDRKDLGSRGTAPRPLALSPGNYRVIAVLEGYEPETSEPIALALGKDTRLNLALTRIVGTVKVDIGGGASAAVRVEDEHGPVACNAPCELQLPPGTHQLYFAREGYRGTPQQVTVIAQKTLQVSATLVPLTGSLVVSADETGALVTVNGRAAGFTPVVIPSIPVGQQKIKVSLRGFLPVEREVQIHADRESRLADLSLIRVREVTAVSRYAEKVDDAPSSVSVIDGQELRAFGYPTLGEALRGVRGVYLSNDRAYVSAGIRGLGEPNDYGNRLLVLSDGQSLNDNILNSSYIGSDGRLDFHDIERIEVVRGPGSLLYGTGAFSGVVNLVTRPRDEPNQVHIGLGTYADSVLRGRVGAHYNITPNAGVWASVSAARAWGIAAEVPLADAQNGITPATTGGVDAFSGLGTAGRVWWGPLTLQWFGNNRNQHIPVGAYSTLFGDKRTRFEDTRWMVEARYEPRLTRTVELMTRAHANHYVFSGEYAFQDAVENIERYSGTWFGAEARVVATPFASLRLTAGGEGQLHPEATLQGKAIGGNVGSETYLDERRPYNFAAAYALVEASLTPWLRLSGGARLDVYSTFGPIVVPRAAIILKPRQGSVVKLMGGRAFRAPSIYEQYYTDGGASQVAATDTLRGTALGPESVYSGEIEVSQRFQEDWVFLGLTHVSHVAQIISTQADTPGSAIVRYVNSPSPALALGADVEVRREWRRGFMLGAMVGYQRARYLDPTLSNARLINAPEVLGSFRAAAPLVADLATAALRINVEAPRRISLRDDKTTRTAVVADLTISGNIRPIFLRYTVGVYNLADRKFEVPVTDTFQSRTMPQNGRTFLVELLSTYP